LGLWFAQIEGQNRHHRTHIRSNKCTQMDSAAVVVVVVVAVVVAVVVVVIGFEWVAVVLEV